jgi:hypothetical protein
MPFCRGLSPVHSAHVGQELEVFYRYHPCFRRKVLVRRVEQRATGQFLMVQGPTGIVISIASWMTDPVVCAGMTIGAPHVDLAALVELKRLLMGTGNPAHSRSDIAIAPEEGNEISQIAGDGAGSADDPDVRQQPTGRIGSCGAGQGHLGARSKS